MKAKISEIFQSIQGEGLYVGQRQIFVRFFGCNLDCKYCDTKLSGFREYEPNELLEEVKGCGTECRWVSFTGGEPLLQKEFLKVALPMFQRQGYKCYLETNGTLPEALKEIIECVDVVAMDLKLPSSTGCTPFWDEHLAFLKIAYQKEVFLKAVICQSTDERDFLTGLQVIEDFGSPVALVLQPESAQNGSLMSSKLEAFRDICLQRSIEVSVIPQVHKLIGVR